MIRFLISVVFLVSLSGCQLTRVEGEVDDVEVKISTKEEKPSHDGRFCPPGQRMKGRC